MLGLFPRRIIPWRAEPCQRPGSSRLLPGLGGGEARQLISFQRVKVKRHHLRRVLGQLEVTR